MKKQKLTLLLLSLGLILSSIIRIRFNLVDGFEYQNVWTSFPAIFDVAWSSSNEVFLTTTIVGYLFFCIASYFIIKDSINLGVRDFRHTLFFVLIVFAMVFEFTAFTQELTGTYTGRHLRIGLLIFIYGISLLNNNYQLMKIKQTKVSNTAEKNE